MPPSSHFLLSFLFILPLTTSVACGGSSDHHGSSSSASTSWNRAVSFSEVGTSPYALGEHVKLSAVDELLGPVTCNQSAGGCDDRGGQSCSQPREPVDSTVESVACEGACVATATVMRTGVIEVDVRPKMLARRTSFFVFGRRAAK